MTMPVKSVYYKQSLGEEVWLSIKTILMQFTGIIVDYNLWCNTESLFENVEWVHGRFTALHDLIAKANSMGTKQSEDPRRERRVAIGSLSTRIIWVGCFLPVCSIFTSSSVLRQVWKKTERLFGWWKVVAWWWLWLSVRCSTHIYYVGKEI